MDKKELEERLALLQSQKDQMVANANALNGAIQECKYWLAKLPEVKE